MSSAAAEAQGIGLRRERLWVALLLVLALLVRLPALLAPLARDFGGYQGAFFSIAACNLERDGLARFAGYPALGLDGPCIGGKDDLQAVRDERGAALLYANHPPTAFVLGWAGAKAFGPAGLGEAHARQAAPVALERAVQIPFLVLHVLGLLAFWWALRARLSATTSLMALALAATAPAAAHYGALANLENPCLPGVLLALGCVLRGRLVRAALALAAAACVTWAPLAFVPLLALSAPYGRRMRSAWVLGLAAAAPLVLHVVCVSALAPEKASAAARAGALLAPIFDGTLPPWSWAWAQMEHAWLALGPALALVALAGLVLALSSGAAHARAAPALALAGGTLLYLLAFYRHTGEEQLQFQLWLVPPAAALAALALEPIALRRARVASWLCAALCLANLAGLALLEYRLARGSVPPPELAGPEIAARVPAGTRCVHDPALGLNFAYAYYAWRDLVPADALAPGETPELRLDWSGGAWTVTPAR